MRNNRLTAAAAVATTASALSLVAVLQGVAWLVAGIGATAVIAIAGTLARLSTTRAGLIAAGTLLIASVPLLAGHSWAGRVVALVLVGVTALGATGKQPARAVAVLAMYCSSLLIYLNLVFASATSYARLIPSPSSIAALSKLPSAATSQFKYAPPIPAIRPVEFFAVSGIGIVAIMVDLLAVRMRRPALAGLPLLVLFSVPVASDLKNFGPGQSLTFAAALAAYLGLLSADGRQRLRMWGRLVTIRRNVAGDDGAQPDTRDVAATGRRIGLAAVCLAVVLPLAMPAKPHDIFAKSPGGGSGLGSGTVKSTEVSPLLTVQQQLTMARPHSVLTYTTTSINAPEQDYLQEWVLNYDQADNLWRPATGVESVVRGGTGRPLPDAVPGLAAGVQTSTVTTKLTLNSPDGAALPLPLPYAPVRILDPGASLTEDSGSLMVFDSQPQPNPQVTVTSREVTPSQADLSRSIPIPGQILSQYGSYTGPGASQLRQIAQLHTARAANQLQAAIDLQNWFTSGAFHYSLRPDLTGRSWLLQFLTNRKQGYCQQFAWAFAVLARLVGIPSRIAVGYTAGSASTNGSWLVTSADAHAWPELYFPSVGWIRFEPTPSGATGQGTAEPPLYTVSSGRAGQGPIPGSTGQAPQSGSQAGGAGKNASGKLRGLRGGGAAAGAHSGARATGFNAGIAVASVVFLLLIAPAFGRWLTRRRRWMAAGSDVALARAAWHELLDNLTDYGWSSLPSESPRALVTRISADAEFAADPRAALRRIGTAEERARYSLQPLSGAGLRGDLATVRRALAASSSRSQRLRALLLPPSTMAVVTAGLQSASRATSWIDAALPSTTGRWRRQAAS